MTVDELLAALEERAFGSDGSTPVEVEVALPDGRTVEGVVAEAGVWLRRGGPVFVIDANNGTADTAARGAVR